MNIRTFTIFTVNMTTFALLAMSGSGLADDAVESAKLERLMAVTVYKTPTCGCCGKWVTHIEDAGFRVTVREMDDLSSIKRGHGIEPTHQSCHTAVTDEEGYVFEGHIPARYIEAFLANPPEGARGLVVPAMPSAAPAWNSRTGFRRMTCCC